MVRGYWLFSRGFSSRSMGFHSEHFHSLPNDTDEMSGREPKLSGEANERQRSFLKLARSSSQNLNWSRLQEKLHLIFRPAYPTVRKVFSTLRSCAPRTESAGTNATKRLQNIRKLQPVKERAVEKKSTSWHRVSGRCIRQHFYDVNRQGRSQRNLSLCQVT